MTKMFNRHITVDPDRYGCTIWCGPYVTGFKGNLRECCDQIYKRTVLVEEGCEDKQVIGISVDIGGFGIGYYNELLNMGLEVHKVTPRHSSLCLPILYSSREGVIKETENEEPIQSSCVFPRIKVISGNRASGVSTAIVMESAEFNIPILTIHQRYINIYKSKAKDLNLEIPEPIYLSSQNIRGLSMLKCPVLIDNGIDMLKTLLSEKGFEGHIRTIGYTLD